MRKFDKLGLTGIVMLLCGAFTFVSKDSFVPLWIAWTVGPLLWYLGFALTVVWGFCRVFGPARDPESEMTTVFTAPPRARETNFGLGPMGVTHEIPSMGGFIW